MSSLSSQVLVLNRGWTPIVTVSAKRALQMMFAGIARAVDAEDYSTYDFDSWADLGQLFQDESGEYSREFILTPKFRIPVPDVVVLKDFSRVPTQKVAFTRKNLFKRDANTCQYCGVKPRSSDLTIDHVKPVSKGGKTTWENCVLACFKCNHKKSNKTLKEVGMKLARKPVEPPRQKMMYAISVAQKKVNWAKFLNDPSAKDQVASQVYWNTQLED
jgi:5-methylcytosine-specific restriction endonuclease McrA